ncbi:Nucleotidylyl transferase [Trichoderma citrinoviride]|uniref:Nucleotidylyl transferase n=1 Tax=Trichoderma citrinoviride TaxID=58853 RepID=A0A2T4B916_9HYPO|nr:Nucleotidylyl transferase [Trichoderma citrinoviride]PTB65823.1 Nucleotidylyl transferase [Trichoderma citrinoviride]
MAPSSSSAPSLLLLPAPPLPLDPHSLAAAYRPPLTAVFKRLTTGIDLNNNINGSSNNSEPNQNHSSHVLVIAIACPLLTGPVPRRKSVNWKAAQSLLARVYTLAAVVCDELDIDTSGEPGVRSLDPRIVLVDHERRRTYQRNYDGEYEANCTPVLDLAAFASTVHPWRTVFHPSTESGYELLSNFLQYSEGKQVLLQNQLVAVEGGITMSTSDTPPAAQEDFIEGRDVVCLGGTFDHLHPGHKLLLHATALLMRIPDKDAGRQAVLIVGISGDELLRNKRYAEVLQPWGVRAAKVLQFLSTIFNSASSSNTGSSPPTSTHSPHELHATFRDGAVLVRCVNIHDPFGPTISEEAVDAIVVSGETRSGGQAINDKRVEKGWKPLEVFEIDVLDPHEADEDGGGPQTNGFASKISSTAIRQRIVQGRVPAPVATPSQ